MQSMLEYIVGRLREEPFGIAIRAVSGYRCVYFYDSMNLVVNDDFLTRAPSSSTQVDFDDKRPVEHLQILNDILSSLKPDLKADIRGAATRVNNDAFLDDAQMRLPS